MTVKAPATPVKIRNVGRAQWFFPFPVTAAEAELAEGVVGLKVEDGHVRKNVSGKRKDVASKICTLALGDREGKPSELSSEVEIPGGIWTALMRDKNQSRAMRGLIDKGEIAIYGAAVEV